MHVRRAAPDTLDPKLNAHSKLNDITACIQAYTAGADEALMLDPHGFVATCNSTHFFIVRGEEVWTSTGMYCLGGITRSAVLRACADAGITAREKSFSLTDVYSADEAFVTGTFAGLVPVHTVDGRRIGAGARPPRDAPFPGRWCAGCASSTVTWSTATSRASVRPLNPTGEVDVMRRRSEPVRLAVWSGPRNISTALMRAWENRPDTVVVDEPLYAYYLNETGLAHPGRDDVIAAGPTDWRAAVADLILTGGAGVSRLLPEAHGPAPAPGTAAGLDPRPAQRHAHPRPVRGGRVLRPVAGGHHGRRPRRRGSRPGLFDYLGAAGVSHRRSSTRPTS